MAYHLSPGSEQESVTVQDNDDFENGKPITTVSCSHIVGWARLGALSTCKQEPNSNIDKLAITVMIVIAIIL